MPRSDCSLEPQFADEFDGTSAFVHRRDLRVMKCADIQVRISEGRMVDEVGCIRSQVEIHAFKDLERLVN